MEDAAPKEKRDGAAHQTVISFGDSSLQQADLDTVRPREWLNDNIIAFWFEAIKAQLNDEKRRSASLWPPSLVELLGSLPEQRLGESAKAFFPPLASTVFLPINDRFAEEPSLDSFGGSHWSLLIVNDAADGDRASARHYDSMPGNNHQAAVRIMHRFRLLIGAAAVPNVREVVEEAEELEPQDNASDCGLYTLALTSLTLLSDGSPQHSEARALASQVDPYDVEKLRNDLRKWLRKWAQFPIEEQGSWKKWTDVVECVGPMPIIEL